MDWGNDPRRLSRVEQQRGFLEVTDWLAEGEKLLKDGFTLRVLAAWLEAARLAEVAGGCRGPGSRGVAGSWLAGQLKMVC